MFINRSEISNKVRNIPARRATRKLSKLLHFFRASRQFTRRFSIHNHNLTLLARAGKRTPHISSSCVDSQAIFASLVAYILNFALVHVSHLFSKYIFYSSIQCWLNVGRLSATANRQYASICRACMCRVFAITLKHFWFNVGPPSTTSTFFLLLIKIYNTNINHWSRCRPIVIE